MVNSSEITSGSDISNESKLRNGDFEGDLVYGVGKMLGYTASYVRTDPAVSSACTPTTSTQRMFQNPLRETAVIRAARTQTCGNKPQITNTSNDVHCAKKDKKDKGGFTAMLIPLYRAELLQHPQAAPRWCTDCRDRWERNKPRITRPYLRPVTVHV